MGQSVVAIEVHAQGQIDGLDPHRAVIAHLGMNAVKIDDRVQRIQRARLLVLHFVHDGIGDRGDQCRRDFGAVHFFPVALNFPHRHASGVER